MNLDAIIFDLDGTLWDSTHTVAESWNATVQRLVPGAKAFSDADIAGIMGCTDREIEEKLFSSFGGRAHELCSSCMVEEPPFVTIYGGKIYEGVEEMLQSLHEKYPLFIVSNCQAGYIEAFLSYSGYGRYFKDFEYLGRKGLSKQENIQLIMERHGFTSCVYVGDTAHDQKSALAAGCRFIFAAYGFGRAVEPDATIDLPIELISTIARL